MKGGIRRRLSLLLVGVIALLIGCGMLANLLFLEKYYISRLEKSLVKVAAQINGTLSTDKKGVDSLITELDRAEGISIAILNKKLQIKNTSHSKKPEAGDMRLPKEAEALVRALEIQPALDYICRLTEKKKNQTPKLFFVSRLENGGYLTLSKPIKGIRESVAIANRFYLYVGLGLLLLGLPLTLLFSRRLTRPVVEMNRVSRQIAQLKFDDRVQYTARNEIGELGQSINEVAAQLRKSIEQLREDIAHRKQLVRNLSHELKTPIGVVKGYAEGLQHGVATGEEKRAQYCAVIAQECDRMDKLVQELLELSALEQPGAQPSVACFEVSSLFRSVLERFADAAAAKGLTIELDCDPALCLSADYALLDRAVGNLLGNAVKYGVTNGHIRLGAVSDRESILLCVFNSGGYLPPEELERVWEVFYKVDKARSRSLGGHGIGLSIVKTIAQLHGGTAFAQNLEDGLAFYLRLPLAEPSPPRFLKENG